MTIAHDEAFGTPDQKALLRRGRAMFELLKDDPRYTYYGRTVGIALPTDANIAMLRALASLQGAGHYAAVPLDQAPALAATLAGLGLSVSTYHSWTGQQSALDAAARVLAQYSLPADLRVITITESSPHEDLQKLAQIAALTSVLPPIGAILRGQLRPGVGLVAVDAQGMPVSCAAGAQVYHPDHPSLGSQAWWGMLSTHPDRRGQRIALILGAMAMQAQHSRFGHSDFMTGIQPGNTPSEALCAKLGLAPNGMTTVTVVDPVALPSGKLTS